MSKRYVHIGSWNIEHMSRRNDHREDNIYALAEHIQLASLDVIALQEVYVTGQRDGRRVNEHLDGVIDLLKEHTDAAWNYEILENRSATDVEQLCVVLWNSSTLDKIGSMKVPVSHFEDGDRLWDRTPHAIKFKHQTKTDFVIIPLHMKANVGGAQKGMRVREKEAKTLVASLPEVRATLSDEDIILIGDTNCLDRNEPALKVIRDAGYEDLNASDAQTFVGGGPFDRVFIPEQRQAFWYSRQYVIRSANQDDHYKYLSDHYLIKTVIKIRKDDDA